MAPAKLDVALASVSLLFVYAAMAIYTISFLIFVFHIARATSEKKSIRDASGGLQKAGFVLLGLGAILHGTGVVTRGVSAGRVPWANMYEFSISGSFLIVLIFLTALAVKEIRVIAAFVNAFALLVLGVATTSFYVQIKTLMPALQSYWLVIHVTVAVLSTAFFNIAAGLAIAYLLRESEWVTNGKNSAAALFRRVLKVFPDSEKLERLSYRFNVVGFILWSFTLIAGAIWAERAWHRYWGWDTKEVWTFIIWTIYAGYLHANATRGWSGKRSAWLALVGFAAILFNFTIVNLYFKGLHVYSGLN
jgi:cytochrome c-type biogenesis protein CcsB